MAIHASSTPAPAPQRGLLRALAGSLALPKSGDSAHAEVALSSEASPTPGVVPAHDTLATVEAEFAGLIAQPWPDHDAGRRAALSSEPTPLSVKSQENPDASPEALPPLPAPLPSLSTAFSRRRAIFSAAELDAMLADHAQAAHRFRALVGAASHGAALLDALDLPPLALDVLDVAIAALDFRDGDPDAEPSFGWPEAITAVVDLSTQYELDLEDDSEEDEGTALESFGRGFVRAGADDAEDDDPAERDDEHGSEDEAHPWRLHPASVAYAAQVANV